MYTENTSIGELLELPQVMALLEKAAPQMVSGPAKGYLTPLTLAQLKVAQPESAQLADAILALANGADVDLTPLDPSKKKPILKGGSTVAQYDIDDVDGKMYMLNHAFSGCFILSFSKPTAPSRKFSSPITASLASLTRGSSPLSFFKRTMPSSAAFCAMASWVA